MKVFIATPTVHGMVTTAYAHSLIAIARALAAVPAICKLTTVDGSEIVTARTALTAAFLNDDTFTHILFLDSDMSVDAAVIRQMVELDVPIVGAAYPKRQLDLTVFASAMAERPDVARARAKASTFAVKIAPGPVEVKRSVVQAEGFGFGCVLIARTVFLGLIERGICKPVASPKLRQMGVAAQAYDFFAPLPGADDDQLSEDLAFCRRVAALGDVPLLAYVGPGVGHVGQFTYSGAFMDCMEKPAS